MGAIKVHEFMTLDGVIDEPTWTADYGFDPEMGTPIATGPLTGGGSHSTATGGATLSCS